MRAKKSKTLSRLGIFLIIMSIVSFLVFYLIVMLSSKDYRYINTNAMELVQTKEIPEGSPTAIIETSKGEIRMVLYPEYAPETVENFISLAESGYYNDTYVFEMKEGVYFSAGSPIASGALDDAKPTNEKVPQEFHQNTWPFRGAVCAMNTSTEGGFFDRLFNEAVTYSGSRFLFVNSVEFTEEYTQEFREASGNALLASAFMEMGGIPNFSQQMTIFAQTYAGFDVIAEICGMQVQAETNMNGYTPPTEECKILSVTISTYGEEDAAMNEIDYEALAAAAAQAEAEDASMETGASEE